MKEQIDRILGEGQNIRGGFTFCGAAHWNKQASRRELLPMILKKFPRYEK